MSFLGSLGSLLTQPVVQSTAAGLLSGVIAGGALVATGALGLGGTSAGVATITLTACPGSGPVLAEVDDGQSLLVTGRSADGQWFEVYVGQPGLDRAWADAQSLRFDESPDALPVADCSGPTPAPLPTPGPTASPTPTPEPTPSPTPSPSPSVSASPSPSPSATAKATATPKPSKPPTPTPKVTAPPTATPTPTPAPTPTPDTTPPSITNFSVSGAPFDGVNNRYYIMGPGNLCGVSSSATISVSISDPGGLKSGSVKLFFNEPGTSNTHQQLMSNPSGNTWQSTIDAVGGWLADNQIVYWIQAKDNAGNTADVSPNLAHRLYFSNCLT